MLPGNGAGTEQKLSSSLFHRDADGKVAFTAEQAEKASDFISNFGLEDRVLAGKSGGIELLTDSSFCFLLTFSLSSALQEKKFDLPQKTQDTQEFFW